MDPMVTEIPNMIESNTALSSSYAGGLHPTSILQMMQVTSSAFTFSFLFLALYSIELTHTLLGPVVWKMLSIFYKLTIAPIGRYISSATAPFQTYNQANNNTRLKRGQKIAQPIVVDITIEDDNGSGGIQSVPIDTNAVNFKEGKEDKKASKGDIRDVNRLKKWGYNKHRFVSDAFLRRNNLVRLEVNSDNSGDSRRSGNKYE
jgi:hypothetical protein